MTPIIKFFEVIALSCISLTFKKSLVKINNYKIFFYRYSLKQLHAIFLLTDTILCTILPSFLIVIVNSLSIYRYRQCMKIYSTGHLRVRFLKVPESENHLLIVRILFYLYLKLN